MSQRNALVGSDTELTEKSLLLFIVLRKETSVFVSSSSSSAADIIGCVGKDGPCYSFWQGMQNTDMTSDSTIQVSIIGSAEIEDSFDLSLCSVASSDASAKCTLSFKAEFSGDSHTNVLTTTNSLSFARIILSLPSSFTTEEAVLVASSTEDAVLSFGDCEFSL